MQKRHKAKKLLQSNCWNDPLRRIPHFFGGVDIHTSHFSLSIHLKIINGFGLLNVPKRRKIRIHSSTDQILLMLEVYSVEKYKISKILTRENMELVFARKTAQDIHLMIKDD